ncbi:hypothetical protein BGZ99_009845 [Dissophora globulifera]|uniref:Store-operated calcium entry-associated regulatory factor n=1 Tax=Dissophora globulifera TaxID=979702 RepID=A0A9P6UMW4_9FUNG|nr:hypothetical protein BGZ99_009845 [Dissophora globulifera]
MKWWSKHLWQSFPLATILVAVLYFWIAPVGAFGGNSKKVLLKEVQTLTLHRGKMTTGRRADPVPQVNCVGGNARGHFEPDVIQCVNTGFDGSDVQWKCQADLPEDLRFGELNVYCEGYGYPDDPYVLKGSCGLEYQLNYKNYREYPYYQNQPQWTAKKRSWFQTITRWGYVIAVPIIFFLARPTIYYFVINWLQKTFGRNDAPPPYRASGSGSGGGGGYGGGGGGGGGGYGGGGWGSGWGNNNSYRNKPDGSDTQGFRPGFWSGLGLGGLATYMATNRNQRPRTEYSLG